ncbi:MAG TPA: hypothetical protein VFE86_16855 [Ilumatobacteraceae bacterium]|nr:hypothetical protein [Ilumatobacteraceae bacterium]
MNTGFALEPAERSLVERTVAQLQQAFGEKEFERTWAAWVAATPESAVSVVFDELG